MAAIDPQAAIDAAQPFCCVPQGDLWYAVLAALIDVGNGDPVPTDPNELMAQAACLKCAIQPGDIPLLMLGAIAAISGGGGGGSGGVSQGVGDPSLTIPADPTIPWVYTDETTGTIYSWIVDSQSWI